MARHTAKSHKIRKVEILVIQMGICKFEKNRMKNIINKADGYVAVYAEWYDEIV